MSNGQEQEQNQVQGEGEQGNVVVVSGTNTQHEEFSYYEAFKRISAMAIPMALSFTLSFEVFASGVLAGNYNDDTEHTAAITMMSTFMNTFVILAISPLFALNAVASNWMGDLSKYKEDNPEIEDSDELKTKRLRIAAVHRYGLVVSSMTVLPAFLVLFFSKAIAITVFRQDESIAEIAQGYLRPYAFAVPGVLARMTFEQMMFTKNKARDAMYIGLTTFTLGTLLSYGLGFGVGSAEPMGFKGIALGYVAESYLIAIMYGLYINFKSEFKEFKFFRNLCGIEQSIRDEVWSVASKMSSAISFTIGNELLVTFVVGLLAGSIGSIAQASMAFIMQFIFLMFIPISAFGIACQILVGSEVGAERYEAASKLARCGLMTTLAYVIPPCVTVIAYPEILRKILDNHTPDLKTTSEKLARIMAVGVIFDAARYAILQELRVLKDNWGSTIISATSLLSGIILSIILGKATELAVYGVGTGYTAGITVAALGLAWGRWKPRTETNYVEKVNNTEEPTLRQVLREFGTWCGFFKKEGDDARPLMEGDFQKGDHPISRYHATAAAA